MKHPKGRKPAPLHPALRFGIPLGLAVTTFLAYLPALSARFVNFDDDRLFLANASRFAEPLGRQLRWMFTSLQLGDYQPLAWLSSSVDYQLSGTNPFSYHLNSVLLHAASAVLLYFIIIRLLATGFGPSDSGPRTTVEGPDVHPFALRLAAAAGALLWAVHPLRVESVAWAAERRDTLSLALLLGSLLAYLVACRPGRVAMASRRVYWLSCVLLLLSLLSKAWGMTLFLCLVILDVYPLRRLPTEPRRWMDAELRPVWLQKLPFAALGLSFGAVAWYAQRVTTAALTPLGAWSLRDRLVQTVYGLAFYVRKTIWPGHLAALYERPAHLDWSQPAYALSLVGVALAVVLIVLLRRQLPALAAAAAAYVAIVAPVLGLAQSGPQLVADRYSYASIIPWMILVSAALFLLWRQPRPAARLRFSAAVTAVAALLLFALTVKQTRVWHDSASLWSHALEVGASSSIAHLNYGQILRTHGDNAAAIAEYEAAVAIRPDYGNAWYNLGNALTTAHEPDRAIAAYRQAIRFMPQRQYALMNLGNIYLVAGRMADALALYREATAFVDAHGSAASSPEPYLALGSALLQAGQVEAARPPLLVAASVPATRPAAERLLALLAEKSGGDVRRR
ncbi:MAG TPA: tetratricopeptide repeat protein [Vicinamibacterales bacterium]